VRAVIIGATGHIDTYLVAAGDHDASKVRFSTPGGMVRKAARGRTVGMGGLSPVKRHEERDRCDRLRSKAERDG
jgi:hypothetical protein